jgi:aminopeptidase N
MLMLILLSMTGFFAPSAAEGAMPAPGVSLALAEERARRVSVLEYELDFNVPADMALPLVGKVNMRFSLADARTPLAIDFAAPQDRVTRLSAAGRDVTVDAVNGHLIVPATSLREGRNEITVEFLAGDASLNRNPDFLYTLFVPARAHLAFPCFDQPDLKGKYRLRLDIPSGWEALSNGQELERQEAHGRTRLTFAETQPISTYLFAFSAGRFAIETAERAGRRFRMFHRETDLAKVARNRDAIFDLHAAALEWLERYTALPYAFGKFDFLLVPSFQFGGMEHPGAIFYNAPALLLDSSATQNQLLGRASVIAHETAHMWFGDLVTMRWFNDVWMKEVFANFMAAKIVNPSFPGIDHELRFLLAHYPTAYDVDRTEGTNAIRQRLENLNEAGSLYGAIIYQKAPIVMRQLESLLGEDSLRDGLRLYLSRHRFANASWPDLIELLDERSDENLERWSRAWVDEPGRPVITTALRIRDGRIARLAFTQRDPLKGRRLLWDQRLHVAVGLDDGVRMLPVRLAGTSVEVPQATGLAAPLFVLPAGDGVGYGRFDLDARSLEYLVRHLPELENGRTRGSTWLTLWEAMLEDRVSARDLVGLALRALPRETDELNVQRALTYTKQAFWKFLSDEERAAVAPDVERVLRAGLDAAPTESRKAAWFATLRDTAQSRPVLEWLERVWRRTDSVQGLTLAEPDYIALALELTVREVPAWNEILSTQLTRIENPDRRARFAFVVPALSSDPGVREQFFESLADVRNRRREPWVLEGLTYLHHPLRAAVSEKYIARGLAMLREIQQTGDIFFPKRWIDATLSGHRSPSAAVTVTRFLAEIPPDYPERLRRVVLSSADDLFRSSGTRRP